MSTTATNQPIRSRNGHIPKGMRSCDNCFGLFPVPPNVQKGKKRKRFCSDNCRKEFHHNKGVSVHKLKDQVQRWVRDELKRWLVKLKPEDIGMMANDTEAGRRRA